MKMTIGEIAAANGEAGRVFEILGIDYACHGNLSLRDACASAGLDPAKVHRSIQQLPRADEVNWLEQPVRRLLAHLREVSHPALGRAISAAGAALTAPCEACEAFPEKVTRIRVVFAAFANTMQPHVIQEDRRLFPLIEHLDRGGIDGQYPNSVSTGNLGPALQALMLDHGRMIDHLDEINRIGEEIIDEPAVCRELIDTLQALDHVVREIIHLENNVLFPRALALDLAAMPEHATTAGART